MKFLEFMVLRYRVSLPGIKGFARIYEVKANTTLYSFHKQMRADMDFPQDQMVMFKGLDEAGAVVARYGIFDLGAGTIDSVTLEQTLKAGVISFVYFYDTTNVKSVIVTYEGEGEPRQDVVYPLLVESKGPNPSDFENGYVAYEDLPDDKKKPLAGSGSDSFDDDDPDDDDEDDDIDVDDDEDGKEIFDESED